MKVELSLGQSQTLKGVSITLILLHHFAQHFNSINMLPTSLNVFLGCGVIGCAMFFFLSSYGIEKTKKYTKEGYFRNRFIAVLIPFFIANICYIVSRFINGARYDLHEVYLLVTGLKQIIPVGWFLYCLMGLYLSMYISVRWHLNKYICTIIGGLLFSIFYPMVTCSFLAFVIGIYVAGRANVFEKCSDIIVLPLLLIVFVGAMSQNFINDFIVNTPARLIGLQLTILAFPLLMAWKPVVSILEKLKVFKWIGEQSMGLYLLHYMVLTVIFGYKEILGIWYSLVIYSAVTLGISYIFNILTGRLVNKTKKIFA